MQFHKFHSIENTYQTKFLNSIRALPCANQEWCVMEKVHGANLSFTTDGTVVRVGKRTSFLTNEANSNTDFFSCNEIVQRTIPKIKDVFTKLVETQFNLPKVKYITVYGELFGGLYVGEKITHKPIQKGIQYCPHQEFIAFDIRIVQESGVQESGVQESGVQESTNEVVENVAYLNYDKAIALFRDADLLHSDILFRGSMDACLEWSKEHNTDLTTIPAIFGLEEKKNNTREGHVLKPLEPAYTLRGEAVVLKDKNDRFKEKDKKTYNPNSTNIITDEIQTAIDEALLYVTETRYDGIVSKYGPLQEKKDIAKYIGLLTQDAMKDFVKDRDKTIDKPVPKPVLKQINGKVTDACRKLVLSKM